MRWRIFQWLSTFSGCIFRKSFWIYVCRLLLLLFIFFLCMNYFVSPLWNYYMHILSGIWLKRQNSWKHIHFTYIINVIMSFRKLKGRTGQINLKSFICTTWIIIDSIWTVLKADLRLATVIMGYGIEGTL